VKNRKLPLFLATLLLAMLLAVSPVIASDDGGVIRVNGDALITVTPDQCIIILGVETINTDAAVAMTENAEIMNRVIAALKSLDLNEEQIRTGIYSVHSQSNFFWQMDIGDETQYRVYNSLTVTLNDLEMIGQVIDIAILAGANQVQSIQMGVKDSEAVMLQALRAATIQARTKAEVIASAAGVEITGIRSINEDWSSFSPSTQMFQAESVMMDVARGFGVSTPIIPNDIQIFGRVSVEFTF